jgi:excisionase family DNA binding protein
MVDDAASVAGVARTSADLTLDERVRAIVRCELASSGLLTGTGVRWLATAQGEAVRGDSQAKVKRGSGFERPVPGEGQADAAGGTASGTPRADGESPRADGEALPTACEVMTADQVAAFLGVDRNTVYDYAARGTIPHRRLGKRVLFHRAALVAWLDPCKVASTRKG